MNAPLADERAMLARTRPLQCEPRTNYANKGSNTAYSLGDLRRARAIYVKLAGPRAAVHSNEESSPCVP